MGSYLEDFPQSSRSTMNLAYQNTDEYPELLEDLENTISQRNKSRVQNTMRHFEYLSRHNKSMEKPLYNDDDERYHRYCRRHQNSCQTCDCCPIHYENGRMCAPTPPYDYRFHRGRRCAEILSNRSMDPCSSDSQIKYSPRSHSNSRWQIDPRNGEWIKIYDSYEFRDYPGLPYPEAPPNRQSYIPKQCLAKLHHYSPSQRHRSGRHHDPSNVCTCHHYAAYNRS